MTLPRPELLCTEKLLRALREHRALPTLRPGSQKPQPLLYAALGRSSPNLSTKGPGRGLIRSCSSWVTGLPVTISGTLLFLLWSCVELLQPNLQEGSNSLAGTSWGRWCFRECARMTMGHAYVTLRPAPFCRFLQHPHIPPVV